MTVVFFPLYFGKLPPTKCWWIWRVDVFSVVIWRFCFYSTPLDENRFPSSSVFPLTGHFCCFRGKNGTFWLKPLKLWSFSAVKVDSHQKGIKGPISASMCWVMHTVPNMKCFLLSRLLFAVLQCFFGFAHTTVSPVSQEDFAHCKDEMDVIIVHCGFRLCTVKLWTVKCTGKFLWKKTESLEEPVKRLSCMPRFFWDYKCVNFTFSVHKKLK